MMKKNDIRFLVTNRCNYSCYFCHKEGFCHKRRRELSPDNYVTLFKLYRDMEKWNGVTISGGEPLLYRNIDYLVNILYNEGAEITIITNGSLLNEHLQMLKSVNTVTVSIHSLNKEVYSKVTGRAPKKLSDVKKNLEEIRKNFPKINIQINVTPSSNGWNNEEFSRIIEYANEIDAAIKFEELYPSTNIDCVPIATLRRQIRARGYTYNPEEGRYEVYIKGENRISLVQCLCELGKNQKNPIQICRDEHELYVNHDSTFELCEIQNSYIDFWEEITQNDMESLKLKMKLAQRRISNEECIRNIHMML